MEISLGAYLKSEREARGVALAEVAAETRVPVASLRSLEADRLDELPGDVFVRGFLRAYARCVELDPDEVLTRLERPSAVPEAPRVSSTDLNLKRRRIATPALLLVLLLASLLMMVVLWRPVAMPSLSVHHPTPPAGTAG